MLPQRIISSDGHVYEPPDLWTSRLDRSLRDRAPRIIARDGAHWWFCEGNPLVGAGAGAQTGRRFERPEAMTLGDKQENVRLGAFDPDARLKDMDLDGVWAEVIYPTAGLAMFKGVADSSLLSAIFVAYNDWLAEFCSAHPSRLKGIGLVNVDDISEGVIELERARDIGLAGAAIAVMPLGEPFDSPDYDPLWAAAQDLDMPLSFHVGTFRRAVGEPYPDPVNAKPSAIATRDSQVRVPIADIIFSGVFERYPNLRVGSVEYELGWIPSFLERMDYTYTQGIRRKHWRRFEGDARPSDFFHRNAFCSFQQDAAGVRDREAIGLDTLMWGSDYPHFESTFPKSREVLTEIFRGVPAAHATRALVDNAARLYHITEV